MCEPRGFVRALHTDQDEHDVVHHPRLHPRRHHRHEPLLQVLVEQDLLVGIAPDVHRQRQTHDGVALVRRPRRQVLQIVAEGMVRRYVVGIDAVLQMLFDDRLHCAELIPQRVFFTVVQICVAVRHAALAAEDGQQSLVVLADGQSLRQSVYLRPAPHLVVAQQDPLREHRLDFLRRGIRFLPRFLVSAVASVHRSLLPFLLFFVHK